MTVQWPRHIFYLALINMKYLKAEGPLRLEKYLLKYFGFEAALKANLEHS